MSTLIILPESNSKGKKDYTGAFLPESKAFAKSHDDRASVVTFDNTLPFEKRRKQLFDRITKKAKDDEKLYSWETVAIFSHGWSTGIQPGIDMKSIKGFCELMEPLVWPEANFLLYCCSTGSDPQDDSQEAPGTSDPSLDGNLGDGSFADTLRDGLCKAGASDCVVMAHRTAGHTTMNPHVVFFRGDGSTIGGLGGVMPVTKKHGKLWTTWTRELKTDFRFEMPFMSVADIHEYLGRKASNARR
jgi:hypothetical protein